LSTSTNWLSILFRSISKFDFCFFNIFSSLLTLNFLFSLSQVYKNINLLVDRFGVPFLVHALVKTHSWLTDIWFEKDNAGILPARFASYGTDS
jgi:hypothetical protein